MNVLEAPLPGVRTFQPDRHDDERGWFLELWNEERYGLNGVGGPLVQTNLSWSARGVLRGMHFQNPVQQGKLISVLQGAIYDVVVDVRLGSRTFGDWFGCALSDENRMQMWAPEGFAHGFLVLSDMALVSYGCTRPYRPSCERTIAWNDVDLAIEWPEQPRMISPKDAAAVRLTQIPPGYLPRWEA